MYELSYNGMFIRDENELVSRDLADKFTSVEVYNQIIKRKRGDSVSSYEIWPVWSATPITIEELEDIMRQEENCKVRGGK